MKSRFQTEVTVQCGTWEANAMHAYPWNVGMYMADGSRKEFRPAGYTNVLGDGYFSVTPAGYQSGGCSGGGGYITTAPMTYYSVDGTYIKLVVDHVANGDQRGVSNPWTLYFPDGSRITGGVGLPQQHFDRNNNEVKVSSDDFGRTITAQAINPDETHFIARGPQNAELKWKVKWKEIDVNKSYETVGAGTGPTRGTTSTQTMQATFRVVEKITLPIQMGELTYEFGYNAASEGGTGWGEISYIKLPSGAEVTYSYSTLGFVNTENVLRRYPSTKTLSYLSENDGQSTPVSDVTNYWISKTGSTVTFADGSAIGQDHGDQSYDNPYAGLVFKIEKSDGSITEQKWEFNQPPWGGGNTPTNPYVKTQFTTIPDASGTPALTAIKDFTLDPNGNTVEVKEYDWVSYGSVPRSGGKPTGIPVGAVLKRVTQTEYYNSAIGNSSNAYYNFSSPPNRGVVKSVVSRDGASNPVARTEFDYDDEDDTANLTTKRVWDSFKGGQTRAYSAPLIVSNSITTSGTYNSYGMPETSTDANGNVTTITYGNISCPSGVATGLYPTQSVAANGTAIERTSSAIYDCYSGLVTTATDVDNNLSLVTEYDDLGRPVKVRNAAGTALESWVQTEYHDADRYVVTKADLEAIGDEKKVAIQHFDQLGRVRLSRTLEDAATESPSNEQHGIKVQSRYATTYSSPNGYTYQLTSNPYRAATSSAASSEPTMGWTRSKAHHLSRHSEIETFSGASLPAPWGANTSSTGMIQTDIDANATTVTDQAGKLRRSITNGLGQLIRVDEPNSSNQLGTISSPTQATNYTYDTLNNLTIVTQGSQTRTFTYSSLSRLLNASHPESGTISYGYDLNGNLTQKTDARNIVTTYTYDALNRVTARDYNDTSPDVDYIYGTNAPKIGKLVKVESDVSTTEYTAFDILGRVIAHKQTTVGGDPNGYTTGYTYSLSGALLEQTYPSGRVVKNSYDTADGSLSQVQSKRPNETYRNLANGFIYNAAGLVTLVRLGNGKWESTVFNSRLQPTQVGLGNGANSPNMLKLEYGYGTTTNNGNVLSQTISVPGIAHPFLQTYAYDELNRLINAEETKNSVQTWEQTFSFDRYGNRNFDEANTTTLEKNCGSAPNFSVCSVDVPVVNPSVNTANNKLNGTTYDAAGNVAIDAEGRQFTYDAENKQIEAENGSSQLIGQYYFDGDGKRVKKIVPNGETTIFVYDASGRLIGEYSTAVQPTQDAKTQYLTNDHLGSPRINTDGIGSLVSRSDYMPYGEEIIGLGGRSSGQGYVADDVRQGFTGYESDSETGLEFAESRMYRSQYGRFTSTDALLSSGRLSSPQSWNRYSYVQNSPLTSVDPFGFYECNGKKDECDKFEDGLTKARNKVAEIVKLYGAGSDEHNEALRAVNAYGKLGDKNGVTVQFGALDKGILGQATGSLDRAGNKSVTVTIDLAQNKSDGNLITTIAHEGSHAQDHADYQDGLIAAGKVGTEAAVNAALAANPTHRQSETRAYGVSSVFAQFTLGGATKESGMSSPSLGTTVWTFSSEPVKATTLGGQEVWKSTWKNLDVSEIRQKRREAINKGLPKDARYAPKLDKTIE
ncbi:MAG: RHS repeat domain-containing protein [Pyrinomonadaceae bacterium]